MPRRNKPIILTEESKGRILKFISISNPNDCWEWTGVKISSGYGRFTIKGSKYLSHRVYFTIINGPIPKGMDVLHRCDNPGRCNPNHLFLGTHQENMRDMENKGRSRHPSGDKSPSRVHKDRLRRGENHWKAKLTEKNVVEIRATFKRGGISKSDLSRKFKVSHACIRAIISCRIWNPSRPLTY